MIVPVSGVRRLSLGGAIGVVVGLGVGFAVDPSLGVLVGIAVAGISTVLFGWWVMWPMDADATRAQVERENIRPVLRLRHRHPRDDDQPRDRHRLGLIRRAQRP